MRKTFVAISSLMIIITLLLSIYLSPNWSVLLTIIILLTILGYYDMVQTKHSIMRIYPVLGRLRYVMEELRPKIYQYFIESDIDGRPISIIDRR